MRRSTALISVVASISVALASVLIVGAPGANAETADPEIAYEGWFARSRSPGPEVDTCPPVTLPPPPTPPSPIPPPPPPPNCGPIVPTEIPTPQSKGTGGYVVSSAGGAAGDDPNVSGDTGWAAFQWDTFEYTGATATKFVVTLSQSLPEGNEQQSRFDTYQPGQAETIPTLQACNIIAPWAGSFGSTAWDLRPTEGAPCVVPEVKDRQFTFDVTEMAQTWLAGDGFGMVILPGTPSQSTNIRPFQITFSGYKDPAPSAVLPKVAFEFTPAPGVDLDGDFGSGGVIDTGGFEDITTSGGGSFEAMPELDVIPTDVGSAPPPAAVTTDTTPPRLNIGRPRPINTDAGFPWIALLFLPLAAIAFWSTGTALGSLGDPVPARRGGVSRVLAQRHAVSRGSTQAR